MLRLFRITCLGASGSGKTSLIMSFVNGCCPHRCLTTDKAVVYHRKVDVEDDSHVEGNVMRPTLVEVEDTPGSELGHPGGEEAGYDDGLPKLRRGVRVRIIADKKHVLALFRAHKKPERVHYKVQMDNMLGKEFTVKSMDKEGMIVGLPSPDGSNGGIWEFPIEALELKTSMTLPVDEFLDMGEKPKVTFKSVKQRKQHFNDLQRPLLAYERPVGGHGTDKTVSKHRMAYFLCFDVSEESGDSLKEAIEVYRMLTEALERTNVKVPPIIWLVACKSDKTGWDSVVRQNMRMADAFSQDQDVPFYATSARRHQGTQEVFCDMIRAIGARQNLWNWAGEDGDELDEEPDDTGGCCLQ